MSISGEVGGKGHAVVSRTGAVADLDTTCVHLSAMSQEMATVSEEMVTVLVSILPG